MTIVYDLYGTEKLCLLSAKGEVERALGETFEERDSSYLGGVYYMLGRSDSENFVLKLNIDPFDGDPVEQSYSSYKILLYVNATNRSPDIEKAIGQGGDFKLLRHEVF
ncbi:UNVERIFIED_ORG: YHS domain-containing protein [Pseudomonas fluorescens]